MVVPAPSGFGDCGGCMRPVAWAAEMSDKKPSGLKPLKVDKKAAVRLTEGPKTKAATANGKPHADNTSCYVCHGNYQGEELVDQHAVANIGCIKCHGESVAHRNDEDHRTPAGQDVRHRGHSTPLCEVSRVPRRFGKEGDQPLDGEMSGKDESVRTAVYRLSRRAPAEVSQSLVGQEDPPVHRAQAGRASPQAGARFEEEAGRQAVVARSD